MSADDKTYLELSEEGEGAHKFYEVTIKGKEVVIRFGRIGDAGQTSSKKYPTPDKAKEDAAKKIQEKLRKGYEPAVMGQRQKRAVTRRPISSRPSKEKPAPVLWKFDSGAAALGIFIDDHRCWVGNEGGKVFALDHEAKVERQFKLPDGVKCIVADDVWIYAGCDNGNVYDLTGRAPRVAYTVAEDVSILWLDIWGGFLGVSDDEGRVSVLNSEEELVWQKHDKAYDGWMVRCDRKAVYHGHDKGVTAYDLRTGKQLWKQTGAKDILFGWQTDKKVYAGTMNGRVFSYEKKGGKPGPVYKCDDAVMSCAASPDGKYVFAGDSCSSVYCFAEDGQRLWKLATGCESALSMQFWKDRLYLVTFDGILACLDASEAAIQAARAGTVPKARQVKAPKAKGVAPATALETTKDANKGVVVKCVVEGIKMRVRVESPGFNPKWNVQFPHNLREPNARYVVEEVREAAGGGFYRAYGDIQKLVPVRTAGRKTKDKPATAGKKR
jgi:outer membrane protein assembly factor BamB